MAPRRDDSRRALHQAREAARMIDQALGQGTRVLDLVQRVQNTPPHQLLGAALQGIGKALEKAERRQR